MIEVKKKLIGLLSSQGLRQSFVVVVGNTAATAISAIALIVISRLLGPSAFGEFSVGFAVVLIMIRFCDLGLNSALQKYIPRADTSARQNALFSFATLAKVGLCIGEETKARGSLYTSQQFDTVQQTVFGTGYYLWRRPECGKPRAAAARNMVFDTLLTLTSTHNQMQTSYPF